MASAAPTASDGNAISAGSTMDAAAKKELLDRARSSVKKLMGGDNTMTIPAEVEARLQQSPLQQLMPDDAPIEGAADTQVGQLQLVSKCCVGCMTR